MNKYLTPDLEIILFSNDDIITTSGNPDELPDDEVDMN